MTTKRETITRAKLIALMAEHPHGLWSVRCDADSFESPAFWAALNDSAEDFAEYSAIVCAPFEVVVSGDLADGRVEYVLESKGK